MRTSLSTVSLSLFALLLAGCGADTYAPGTGATAAGIFADACANCHGDGGEGKFGLLRIKDSVSSELEIAEKIAAGSTLMPAFPNIGESERMALAKYLKP